MSSQIEMDLGGLLPTGEKRKLLNQFIIQVKEADQVNKILDNLKNLSTPQYNLLKFLLADKFHRIDLIVELLYDGDVSIASDAITKRWLYETENSVFADSDFLINKLFPNVSYNVRQKVIYRIGKHLQDQEKADQIWNVVEQKYGFHVALPVLPACTKDKVSSVLIDRKVDLSGYQLVQILKKFPDVGLQYIRSNFPYLGSSSTNSYRSPLVYLFENHPDDFLDLCINHRDKMNPCKIGRRRSTKMIHAHRAKLLEKPTEASSLLKFDRIRREFSGEEFQKIFESSLANTTLSGVNMAEVWKWVNTLPEKKRLDMVNQTFMNLYQVDLDDNQEYMDPMYITLLPDERRLSVVDWKNENDKNYGWRYKDLYVHYYKEPETKRAWLSLKPISHSVPEIQKLLLIEQEVSMRATFSKNLLHTCFINSDLPHLLSVLQLLNKRCRNDQSEVRSTIFSTLDYDLEKMEFAKEHWDVIVEMIQAAIVFADSRDYSDSNKERLLERCIAFHVASKLPLNNLISMYIKLKIKTGKTTWTNEFAKTDEVKRNVLVAYAKELEHLQQINDLRSHDGTVLEGEKLTEFVANLIEEICKFNKATAGVPRKVEAISFASNKWLRSSLEAIAKEEESRINKKANVSQGHYSWQFAKQLVNIIQALRKEESLSVDAFNDSENLFSTILHASPCSSIVTHFLTKNPSQLVEHWPTTLSQLLKTESPIKLMKHLHLWNYSSLTDQAIKICSEIVERKLDTDSDATLIQQKCNAVAVLSVLSKPTDFLSIAEKYYPVEKKVDVFADNSKEDYEIHQAIAKSLVNVSVSHLAFPAVEKFCVGDYLKIAVTSLYSHCGRASEAKTLNFLRRKLINSPVSLHKHIIRLYYVISSVDERINAFKEIDSSNVTIRYELFCRANKLFRSSPSQQTWTILKGIIDRTEEDDASIISALHTKPKLETCPVEYLSEFIAASLAVLRKLKPENITDFMGHVERIVDKVPESILDQIILHDVAKQTDFNSSFCVKYIENSTSESTAEHRLSNMWLVIKNVYRNGWNTRTPQKWSSKFDYPTRISISTFVTQLTQNEMMDASKAWLKKKAFQTLLENFKAESEIKFYKEIFHLELGMLAATVIETGSEHLKPFGQGLARLTDSMVAKYGAEIVVILKVFVNSYVTACFSAEINGTEGVVVKMVEGILETSKTTSNQIVSMNLLDDVHPKSKELIVILEKINAVFNESNDAVAQMFSGYLANPL